MEMPFGSAHVTLPVWVLVVVTALSTICAVAGAYILGRARPTSRLGRWLRWAFALVLLLITFELTALFSHAFVFATDPRLRGYPVNICFGDPHWNMLIGGLFPPVAAIATFLLARRTHRRQAAVLSSPPATSVPGA